MIHFGVSLHPVKKSPSLASIKVIPAGTTLYHGTQGSWWEGDRKGVRTLRTPKGPAWVSDSWSVSLAFATMGRAQGNSDPRILTYRTTRPIRLSRVDNHPEFSALMRKHGIDPLRANGNGEKLPMELYASLPTFCSKVNSDGWIWVNYYGQREFGLGRGSDILLCAPDEVLSPVSRTLVTHEEWERADEEIQRSSSPYERMMSRSERG